MKMIIFDWGYIMSAAVIVVGIIQWAKNLAKNFPAIVWVIIVPVVSIGVAFAADGGIYQIITNGLAIWAICQIGYEFILQNATKMIQGFMTKSPAVNIIELPKDPTAK